LGAGEEVREAQNPGEEKAAHFGRRLADAAFESFVFLNHENAERGIAAFEQKRRGRAGDGSANHDHIEVAFTGWIHRRKTNRQRLISPRPKGAVDEFARKVYFPASKIRSMPIYEFYSPDTHKIYSFFARSLAHANKTPRCPDKPDARMERVVSKFAVTGRAKEKADTPAGRDGTRHGGDG
jgi:hypothetical protein